MNEWLMILVVLWCAGLFAAGGTDIPGIGGQKWLRRILMPLGLIGIGLFHTTWWAAVGSGLTIAFWLHLGYGSKANWAYRAVIFAGYGLFSLWIGWSWWVLVTPVICSLLFLGSNTKETALSFVWKLCELGMGFLIGASFVAAILNQWR